MYLFISLSIISVAIAIVNTDLFISLLVIAALAAIPAYTLDAKL